MEKSKFLKQVKGNIEEAGQVPAKEEVASNRETCASCENFLRHRFASGIIEVRCKMCKTCGGKGRPVRFGVPKRVFNCPIGRWDNLKKMVTPKDNESLKFRVLNLEQYGGKLYPEPKPDVRYLQIHGRRILLNADTLAAADCDGTPPTAPSERMPPELRPIFRAGRPNFQPPPPRRMLFLVFEITHNCNLACEYCFVRHQKYGELPRMGEETAMKALDLFPPRSDISVGFFGGEPLLEFKLIGKVVAEVERRTSLQGKQAKFHVTTNGVALRSEVASFLKKHNFSLIVSLDGNEEQHNALRKPRNRSLNSYKATLEGLMYLRERGIAKRAALRGTYTALDFDIVSRLEHLNSLCDEGLGGAVAVEPIMLGETGCAEPTDDMQFAPDDYPALAGEIHHASEWFVGRIRSGREARYKFIQAYLRRLLHARPSATECGAGRGYISVGPRGTLYACHREGASDIGSLARGLDEAKAAKWQDNRLYCRAGCMECWARHICGGGCRYNSLNYLSNIAKPHPFSCWFTQTQIKEALWLATQLTPEQLGRIR